MLWIALAIRGIRILAFFLLKRNNFRKIFATFIDNQKLKAYNFKQ